MKNNKQKLILLGEKVDNQWLNEQINHIVARLKSNMQTYQLGFPSACATQGKYRIKANDDWTNGFWTGMLCLAYELTGGKAFLELIDKNVRSFQDRLDQHFVLDHHDIGFLYSLSAGAAYKITEKESDRLTFLQAADVLVARYQEKGRFIQAWGKYGDPKEYRLIIDSILNLPILLMATELSGEERYAEIAKSHYETLLKTIFRDNFSTYHTYYFDVKTGAPLQGAMHQGNSHQSTWARGQSWAILGIPLVESYLASEKLPDFYSKVVALFIDNLPEDLIPYWDFDFTDDNPSAKDSSAAAIVACGLLEAEKFESYPDAKKIAKGLIYQLGEKYTNWADQENEGLLQHGVYAYAEGKGIDEPNLWGDYFYFEALMRLVKPDWHRYW
ncbi:glycoside hydrolase family 88 protein [Pseudolactococcus yaeyamensis]